MHSIIFDFDGVIHDTFELICGISAKIDPNFCREKMLSYFEGNILQTVGKKETAEVRQQFRSMEAEAFQTLEIEREIKAELEELHKSFDLYIITSNTKQNLITYFENNHFTDMFKDILAAEAHAAKDEKFKMLFDKYGFDADACVFVTDTLGDIREAHKVGVKTIACTFGYHDEATLRKGDPLHVVTNFMEIRQVITGMVE